MVVGGGGGCLHKRWEEGERINWRIEKDFFNKRKGKKMVGKCKIKRNNSMWSNNEGNLWKWKGIGKDVSFLCNEEVANKKKNWNEMKNWHKRKIQVNK